MRKGRGKHGPRCDPLRLYTYNKVISVPMDIHKSRIRTHGYPQSVLISVNPDESVLTDIRSFSHGYPYVVWISILGMDSGVDIHTDTRWIFILLYGYP